VGGAKRRWEAGRGASQGGSEGRHSAAAGGARVLGPAARVRAHLQLLGHAEARCGAPRHRLEELAGEFNARLGARGQARGGGDLRVERGRRHAPRQHVPADIIQQHGASGDLEAADRGAGRGRAARRGRRRGAAGGGAAERVRHGPQGWRAPVTEAPG
jgi:hypothetical protein